MTYNVLLDSSDAPLKTPVNCSPFLSEIVTSLPYESVSVAPTPQRCCKIAALSRPGTAERTMNCAKRKTARSCACLSAWRSEEAFGCREEVGSLGKGFSLPLGRVEVARWVIGFVPPCQALGACCFLRMASVSVSRELERDVQEEAQADVECVFGWVNLTCSGFHCRF